MLKEIDLVKPRTPSELKKFIDEEEIKINKFKSLKKYAYQRKGLYKQYYHELIPFNFFIQKYFDDNYLCNIIVGNQGYDAIIRNNKTNDNIYIEITYPLKMDKIKNNLVKMIETGSGDVEVSSNDFIEQRTEIINNIKSAAINKAIKDYNEFYLLITLNFLYYQSIHNNIKINDINYLINEIKKINFTAKKVFLIDINNKLIYEIK